MYLSLSICSGAFALYAMFHQESRQAINECLNGATDDATRKYCNKTVAIVKGIAVALFVIMWLLIICQSKVFFCSFDIAAHQEIADAYIIVSNYVEQLDDEMAVKETKQMINAISHPAPVTTYGAPPTPGYPFNQTNQAHGGRGNLV